MVTTALTALALLAPLAKADKLDDLINAKLKANGVPGLSLAIIDGGKIVKAKGYGFADLSAKKPVTVDTLFQAGSISKSVAAMGALRLVEAGMIDLDKDINSYLTSWKVPENEFTKDQKVTLRRILSHTAGINIHGFVGYTPNEPRPTLVQVLKGEKPANTPPIQVEVLPGSIWRYSGGGYTVMQQALIDITGKPFEDYMADAVLKPFGMASSSYAQPMLPSNVARSATGYITPKDPVKGRWDVYPEMAAAGLWTTASDLARFAIGVQNTLAGSQKSVISQAMAKTMTTVVKSGDGLGVFLSGKGPSVRFFHDGRDAGFDAMMVAYAETGQGAVIMINTNLNASMIPRILEAIAAQYHWPDYPVMPVLQAITDKEPGVTKDIRQLLGDLTQSKLDESRYTPEVAKALKPQLGGIADWLKKFGKLKKMELIERRDIGDNRLYRYRLTYPETTVLMAVQFDKSGKIAGVNLLPE